MPEIAAEKKGSRNPEVPADIVILFVLMKNNSPQKQAAISWIILMIGILLAVIGAMTAKEYRVNLCLLIGAMVVVGGIVYHLTMMKCPYCGCSLVGYRPIPKECPKCHKKFEE
jgi:hypothetical protein